MVDTREYQKSMNTMNRVLLDIRRSLDKIGRELENQNRMTVEIHKVEGEDNGQE